MAEARRTSLLDFAIAASVAIVPLMVAVMWLVAVIRPADPGAASWRGAEERYLSVRHIAALKTFEHGVVPREPIRAMPTAAAVLERMPMCRRDWGAPAHPGQWLFEAIGKAEPIAAPAEHVATQLGALDDALLRFSTRPNARVGQALGFDAERWFAAANASLAAPLEPTEYPGQRFQVRCADLALALTVLTRADARMLDNLAWRGTVGSAVLARWRPDQQMEIAPHQVMRRNPWSGIAGCIYLGRHEDAAADSAPGYFLAGARSMQRRICATPAMVSAAPAVAASSHTANEPAANQPVARDPAGGQSATSQPAATQPAASRLAALRAPSALLGEPGLADPVDDTRWMVPPSLQTLLQPLEALRQPTGLLYRLVTDADERARPAPPERDAVRGNRNRIVLDGAAVDVGFSVDLTIDPTLQALAQKTAACYTGRHDVCDGLGIRRNEDRDQPLGHQLLEGAMVRMAAVAIIDVASGRIEALAGALSPCARQEVDGPGRDPGCDKRLPFPAQYRPDALLNPAVFHDAMPASTIKPIMAAAFLADSEVGVRWLAAERAAMRRDGPPARDSLRGQLMRSDSARFLDRMFCSDKNYANCRRPWAVQAAAAAFGWNAGCTEGRGACGKHDLLFGRAVDAPADPGSLPTLSTPVAYGRILSEPRGGKLAGAMQLMPSTVLDAAVLRRCGAGADARRLSDDDWEKCRGGAVVDVVAEGWGQGHARASALGVAGMMATLAAAANGQMEVRRPHLVEGLHRAGAGDGGARSSGARAAVKGGSGADAASAVNAAKAVNAANAADAARLDAALKQWRPGAAQPNRIAHDAAEVILSGLSFSHRAGTARSACEQVFDARRCRDIDWLAGKTGTPSFPSDGIGLDELARLCQADAAARPTVKSGACSSLRPYKWYVAAYRADATGKGPWTKAIAVLTERNWLRRSGQVHGAGDHGPNPSAEIAMQIAGRRLGLFATAGHGAGVAP